MFLIAAYVSINFALYNHLLSTRLFTQLWVWEPFQPYKQKVFDQQLAFIPLISTKDRCWEGF